MDSNKIATNDHNDHLSNEKSDDDNILGEFVWARPDSLKSSTCMFCLGRKSLWFCLTCGFIGCGRHQNGHSYEHFKNTGHVNSCSLDLEVSRIWNYKKMKYTRMPEIPRDYKCTTEAKKKPSSSNNIECNCPVCRYHQMAKMSDDTVCMSCQIRPKLGLWLCLSCSYIGCGRKESRHALEHYNRTQHRYVMQLHNFSIWDYQDEEYVHRLYNESPIDAAPTASSTQKVEHNQDNLAIRLESLEHEWKNFCKLKETNRQMISIEERLIALSEEKKMLENKLLEHDARINELLNEFNIRQTPVHSVIGNNFDSATTTLAIKHDNRSILSLYVSDNLEYSQLITFFILFLFLYQCINLFVVGILGKK